MVLFTVANELFIKYPQLKIGVVIIKTFDNNQKGTILRLRDQEKAVRKELQNTVLSDLQNIKVWREAYSNFGAKPKKYKSSVEALLTRVLEGEELPDINPLVNIYNYISIKYKLPLGADDLDKVNHNIELTFASGGEKFTAINSDETKSPEKGEVVYKMNDLILCRRWNWREADATKITENTKNAILYCESLLQDDSTLTSALKELQKLTGGEIKLLDSKNNSLDLAQLKLSHKEVISPIQDTINTKDSSVSVLNNSARREDKKVKRSEDSELVHWTDITAEKVIREKGDKEKYVVASGITPSGVIHIGNFREIITVDLVKRALEKRGKKVRFIYSWDNYDVFRKVPKDMPKQEMLQSYLRKPIIDTPDVYGCHKSYAEHNQAKIEADVPSVGINPEFIYQAERYRKGDYVKGIKKALDNCGAIKKILNNYREEPLSEDWLPISLFCEICGKDTVKITWIEGHTIKYNCECGHTEAFDFRKKPIVKLLWRIDWPMRWEYEKVDFEPGGKDHSTVGGSFDTGKQIVKEVYNYQAPTYVMYDFIKIKGGSGKMSSSKGGVVDLGDVLEIYQPEIVRWLFAGTRPNKEFAISFDSDVLKIYEDFDKCERIYFGVEKVNEKEMAKQKIAYELSSIKKIPKTIPYQPGFRHLTTLLQIHSLDSDKVVSYYEKELNDPIDRERVRVRTICAKNWLKKHAPEEFRFTVQEKCQVTLVDKEKEILKKLAAKLQEKDWTDVELHEEIYILCKNQDFPANDFFKLAYNVLINKDKGPRLASFILAIGKQKVMELLEKI